MKRQIRYLVIILMSIALAMTLAFAFTPQSGKSSHNNDIVVSAVLPDDTIIRDTAKLEKILLFRGNTTRGNDIDLRIPAAEQTGKQEKAAQPTFKLPASLQSIEDEAFEGTALVEVEIPEKVEHIGERAFSNIPSLRNVRIPEQTTSIAKTAFAGSNHVLIIGVPGSYARKYAAENRIPFAPLTVMYANAGTGNGISLNRNRVSSEALDNEEDSGEEENKPTGRTVGEIKARSGPNGMAYHITGRAPPADA